MVHKVNLVKGCKPALIVTVLMISTILLYFVYDGYAHFDTYFFDLSLAGLHGPEPVSQGLEYTSEGNENDIVDISGINLRKGDYVLKIKYEIEKDTTAYFVADNSLNQEIYLSAAKNEEEIGFSLKKPTERAKISINTAGGKLLIRSVSVTRNGRLVNDGFVIAGIICIIAAGLIILIWIWDKLEKETRAVILSIAVVTTLVNLPYLFPYIYLHGDNRHHLYRISGLMFGIMDGQFPVIVSPNWANEFGELSFLYPNLFLYPSAALMRLGVSILLVYKLALCTVNAATAVSVYISVKSMKNDHISSMICMVIYMLETGRLSHMYRTGVGLGMALSAVFFPLMIAGIYHITNGDIKKWYLLSFGISGVMESHVVSTLLSGIFLTAVCLVFLKKLFGEGRILGLLKAAGLTIAINIGFIVIFVRYYFTDWNKSLLESYPFYTDAYSMLKILTDLRSAFTAVMIILSYFALAVLKDKSSEKDYKTALCFTIISSVGYLMSTKLIPWHYLMVRSDGVEWFTHILQYPFRFVPITECVIVITHGLIISSYREAFKNRASKIFKVFCVFTVSLMVLAGTVYEIRVYFNKDVLLRDQVWGNYITVKQLDYLPAGADEESIEKDAGKLSDEEAVNSISYTKNGTHIDYVYEAVKEGVVVDLPLLYYTGYTAYDEKGEAVRVFKGDNGHVNTVLNGDGKKHELHVGFKVKKIYTLLYLSQLLFATAAILGLMIKRHAFLTKVSGHS